MLAQRSAADGPAGLIEVGLDNLGQAEGAESPVALVAGVKARGFLPAMRALAALCQLVHDGVRYGQVGAVAVDCHSCAFVLLVVLRLG